MNRHVLGSACAVVLLLCLPGGRTAAQGLDEADHAFEGRQTDRALSLYTAVARGDGDPADRAKGASMAALILWRFQDKHDEAARLLDDALEGGCDELPVLLARSRLERDRGDFERAWSAASRGERDARKPADVLKARIERAKVAVEEGVRATLAGVPLDAGRLEEARSDLLGLLDDGRDLLVVSRLLLRAAILLGDGGTALRAWRSYFRIDPAEGAYGVLVRPEQELSEAWPGWQGASDRGETDDRLIRSLAESRLYQEAVILARRYGAAKDAPDEIADILAYGRAMIDLEKYFDEQYRLYAAGRTDGKAMVAGFAERIAALWNESSWSAKPCPVPIPFDIGDPEAAAKGMGVLEELTRRFGMIARIEEGGADITVGHAIVEETREIEQYGHRARFTYYLLDDMVTGGWLAWATDGTSRYGGWPTEGVGFTQIREPYADAPVRCWMLVTDPETRAEYERVTARLSESDWATAEENPYAFLPGLVRRMGLTAYDRLLRRLESEGLEGERLRRAFVTRLGRAIVESSIFAHEGRHVIDLQLGIGYNAELEFRAKLSEVAFAPIPRLSFGSIFSAEIGKDSAHGQADLRIVKGIVAWMQANAGRIKGLDPSRPLLPQFDRLTDEQMREVMRSMDPLAADDVDSLPRGAR